jgi:hypothetical protein
MAIAGGLLELSLVSSPTTTYSQVIPGMLLIGLGAGLVMPTATDSVIGSVPRGDAGVGSATNGVAIQVGGALGVAVIGSALSTRYRDHLSAMMAGQHVPAVVAHTALGSLGGAIGIATKLPEAAGAELVAAAGSAFMSGVGLSLAIGAFVALGGVVVALLARPLRPPGAFAVVAVLVVSAGILAVGALASSPPRRALTLNVNRGPARDAPAGRFTRAAFGSSPIPASPYKIFSGRAAGGFGRESDATFLRGLPRASRLEGLTWVVYRS